MPKQSHLLDDIQIKRWIAKGEALSKSDGDGLTFTLSGAGTATWVLRYRMGGGRRKELTLGNYPDLTLAVARKMARAHRAAIDGGVDPAAEKKSEKARSLSAWLVRDLAADFEAKKLVAPLAEGTIYYRKSDLTSIILPKIGSLEVRKVTPADVVHMIESSKRPWTVCKRLLTTVTQLFAHACGKRMINVNPCVGIDLRALMGQRPPVRKRVMLTEEDLRSLLGTGLADAIGAENALALMILLATCVRGVELVKARWEHVYFDRASWWVPDESVKTRSGFLVPLTPTVIEWFRQLKEMAGDSEWVLPARRSDRAGQPVGRTTLWAAINRAFNRGGLDIRRFTPHDTRSTAKGHMRNIGIPREMTEIALNHKLKGMEAIYDVREEIPERRDALERWAAFIEACESGRPWNVVSISSAA